MQNNDKNEIIDEEILEEGGLQDKLKKLREELKACQKAKAEYLAGWQRAKADFINARKDEEKVRNEFVKFAASNILREMLAVADSLELAGSLARRSLGEGGADTIYNQLLDILKKQGVEPIEAKNAHFDPLYHEALEQVEVSEKEKEGIVLEELQKGYIIHNRVLRPSKVKVGVYKIN